MYFDFEWRILIYLRSRAEGMRSWCGKEVANALCHCLTFCARTALRGFEQNEENAFRNVSRRVQSIPPFDLGNNGWGLIRVLDPANVIGQWTARTLPSPSLECTFLRAMPLMT
jgi:hypothetical protein